MSISVADTFCKEEPVSEKIPQKRGPKPTYEKVRPNERGAPRLTTRLDPVVLDWINSRPEGVRPYLERVVTEDMRTAGASASTVSYRAEDTPSPDDVPGQILIAETTNAENKHQTGK